MIEPGAPIEHVERTRQLHADAPLIGATAGGLAGRGDEETEWRQATGAAGRA